MQTEQKWIVVRIDGKIAAISTDYRQLAAISSQLAQTHRNGGVSKPAGGKRKGRKASENCTLYSNITATAVTLEEVMRIRHETQWDDMLLFGTDFQKKVWRKLWELTHHTPNVPTGMYESEKSTLLSYSDFADLCQNKAGVRAVAHAIGLNPVAVVIPCHLVIPKESVDYLRDVREKAQSTIFKGDDICLINLLRDKGIDFGEYALGRDIKRELIQLEHSNSSDNM